MNSDVTLTGVLVLYGHTLQESVAFQSLCRVLENPAFASVFCLVVYDNSPQPGDVPAPVPWSLRYQHDPANGGVAAAYNAGLAEARRNGSAWLLLLDQDTELTPAYLAELLLAIETAPERVAAIVPRLMQNGVTHSPQQLPRLSHRPLGSGVTGLLQGDVTAYNSGAALRVSALQGFPTRYWLDFLDHAVFHTLQAAGGRVWLLQATLEHQLSTERLGMDASVARYRNVLQAERDFYGEYGSLSDRLFYHLRRSKQALGQFLKVSDKHFALLSLRAALGLLPPTPPR